MSAVASGLPPEMRPAAIRDALIDQERADFLRSYREAIVRAAESLDLSPVFRVLANYHRIAVATQQQGVEAHRRLLAKADLIARTGKNPDARPYEELKTLLDPAGFGSGRSDSRVAIESP